MSEINKQQDPKQVHELELELIKPDPNQPRSEAVPSEGLLESIKNDGVKQPINVRYEDGATVIVDGELRCKAAKTVGLNTIPVIYDKMDSTKAFEIGFVLNFLRKSLTAIETAEALYKIQKNEKLNQTELGKRFGIKQNSISEYIGLTRLTKNIKDRCRKDQDVSKRALLKISKITNDEAKEKAFNKYYDSLEKKRASGKQGENSNNKDTNNEKTRKTVIEYAENNTQALKERYEKIAKNIELCSPEEQEKFKVLLTEIEAFASKMKADLNK